MSKAKGAPTEGSGTMPTPLDPRAWQAKELHLANTPLGARGSVVPPLSDERATQQLVGRCSQSTTCDRRPHPRAHTCELRSTRKKPGAKGTHRGVKAPGP